MSELNSSGILLDQVDGTLIQLVLAGGPIVWLLMFISVFALGVILLKVGQFFRLQPENIKNVSTSLNHWQNGDIKIAKKVLQIKFPVQDILFQAMEGVSNNHNLDNLQKDLTRKANELIHQLRLYLRPLEVIASLSPLLGLMGTVVGMIIAFKQMEAAGSNVDPAVLSGGIWQALLTTAAGLTVAIPVAAMHSYFERKVERISHVLNSAVSQVFTTSPNQLIKAEVKQVGDERAA